MAEVVIKTIFQFHRGYSYTWQKNNPILRQGEPGYELDTKKLKIGDGSTPWNDLRYFGGNAEISADEKSITFTSAGSVTLYGFNEATENQIPIKGSDGKLDWVDNDEALSQAEIDEILRKE